MDAVQASSFGFKVQRVHFSNAQEVQDLKEFLLRSSDMHMFADEDVQEIIASWAKKERFDKGVACMCTTGSGKICGFLFCDIKLAEKSAQINQITILEKYIRHEQMHEEIMIVLLQYLQFFCKRLSIPQVTISVDGKNSNLVAWYGKFGFYEAHALINRGLRLARMEEVGTLQLIKKW